MPSFAQEPWAIQPERCPRDSLHSMMPLGHVQGGKLALGGHSGRAGINKQRRLIPFVFVGGGLSPPPPTFTFGSVPPAAYVRGNAHRARSTKIIKFSKTDLMRYLSSRCATWGGFATKRHCRGWAVGG